MFPLRWYSDVYLAPATPNRSVKLAAVWIHTPGALKITEAKKYVHLDLGKKKSMKWREGGEKGNWEKTGLKSVWQNAFAICADAVSIIWGGKGEKIKRGKEERFSGPRWLFVHFFCCPSGRNKSSSALRRSACANVGVRIKDGERMRE